MTCLVVYGTRPELIKLMPVIRALRENTNVCKTAVISTGQHRELILPLEKYFELTPDGDMELMLQGQSLASLFTRAEIAMTTFFEATKPTLVIVQGDTTTAMAAGIAGFHAGVHVVHVEAGLRTGDMSAPFPEEFNRKAIGIACSLCFAPTKVAEKALLMEGVMSSRVFQVGNTVVDALHHASERPPSEVVENGGVVLNSIVDRSDGQKSITLKEKTSNLLSTNKHVVLITAHRRENAASGAFSRFGRAVGKLAKTHPEVMFIVPLHYNPAVRTTLIPFWKDYKNIWLVEPPAYPVFVQLLLRVTILLTDSGGLQEEGISLHLPVLIMRTKTERLEGVVAGGAKLVGDEEDAIFEGTSTLLTEKSAYEKMTHAENPYGDGSSSKQIVSIIDGWRDRMLSTKPQFLLQFVIPNATEVMVPRVISTIENSTDNKGRAAEPGKPRHEIEQFQPTKRHVKTIKGAITVILTGYKRPPWQLRKQIEALKNSTLVPHEIIFYQNENFQDFSSVLKEYPDVKHVHNVNYNTRFHGRFTLALLVQTEYVAVVDDEPVPGKNWLKYAIKHVDQVHAIVGTTGRRVTKGILNAEKRYQTVHDSKLGKGYTEVDFIGHWWVWRTEWTNAMFSLPSVNLWTAEDIEFCAKLQILLGVKSISLNYPDISYRSEDISISSPFQRANASWSVGGTNEERIGAVQYWITQGWEPFVFRNE